MISLKRTVDELVPMDDTLFHKLVEQPEFVEELLQVLLQKPSLKVTDVSAQKSLRNIKGRSVLLDALCLDEVGNYINVEVQKQDNDDHQKRVRYNGSNIDTFITEKGSKFKELPDVYIIYISKFDMFGKGYTMYHIDRTIRETKDIVDNGFHEIYVNTKIDDGTDIAALMQIFESSKVVKDNRFPNICSTIYYFKEGKGRIVMCETVERYAKEVAKEAAKEATKETAKEYARNMFLDGLPLDKIKKYVSELTEEELLSIQKETQKLPNTILK